MTKELNPENIIEKYLEAGKIVADIKKQIPQLVKPGMKYIELAEFIENKIIEKGGKPAFPCNISWAYEAAHYTPIVDDDKKIPDKGILKVDFGAHVDGYISDTSISIDLSGENEDLIKAVEEALDKVIEALYPGIRIEKISEIIEKTIESYGARPIRNLTGHSLDHYNLHAGVSIPNTKSTITRGVLKPGMALAIEPFATKGIGYVIDSNPITIYSIIRTPTKKNKGLSPQANNLYKSIYNDRKELPFTERWYIKNNNIKTVREAISQLFKKRFITGYPILVEASGSEVSQAEDSFLILEKEVIVYTR